MLLLWLFHLKEEYGSHQESTSETFIHKRSTLYKK
jgi:hypothetical protein